jgi:hypothetical protein
MSKMAMVALLSVLIVVLINLSWKSEAPVKPESRKTVPQVHSRSFYSAARKEAKPKVREPVLEEVPKPIFANDREETPMYEKSQPETENAPVEKLVKVITIEEEETWEY